MSWLIESLRLDRTLGLRSIVAALAMLLMAANAAEAKDPVWSEVSTKDALAKLGKETEFVECSDLTASAFEPLSKMTWLRGICIAAECELDESVLDVINALPKVETIKLPGRVWAKEDSLYGRLFRSRTLRHLYLDGSSFESLDSFRAIADLKHLATLSLWRVTGAGTDDMLAIISKLPLTTLSITPWADTSEDGVRSLSACTTLQHLDMEGFWVTDKLVQWFVSNTKLSSLTLSDARVTRIAGQAERLADLERLGFGSCSDLTQAAVTELKKLPCLSYLTLNNCKNLDGKALLTVSECLGLKYVDLTSSSCNDDLLKALVAMPVLEELRIAFCKDISARGLAALRESETLKRLSLAGCSSLSQEDLGVLTTFPGLIELDLSSLNAVTGDVVKKLAMAQSLKKIVLRNCPKVEGGAIKAIRVSRPNLVIEHSMDSEK